MSTVPRIFLDRVAATPERRAHTSFVAGVWRASTWQDYGDDARAFGLGLVELGMRRGDTVAILGPTRREWCVCDLGALGAGAVTVGLYPTLVPEGVGSMHYVIDHSEARFLVVESAATLRDKLGSILARLGRVERIIVWEGDASAIDPRVVSYEEVCARGRKRDPDEWRRSCEAARPEDVAVLIYTSGTTGQPKGVMLTHGNVVSGVEAMQKVLPEPQPDERTISFLPMAHIAERVISHYWRIYCGVATTFARSLETLIEDLAKARPTAFGSVPRIFEKVHARVLGELSKLSGLRAWLARAVLDGGVNAARARLRGDSVGLGTALLARLFEKKIGAPLRGRFGGDCRWFVSGAAPIAVDVLEFFHACGMVTYEI